MTVRLATMVYLGLLGLLTLTVASTLVPLGLGNTLINFAVAVAKAALIALFFMHLRRSGLLVTLTIAVIGFWLILLYGLTLVDFLSR